MSCFKGRVPILERIERWYSYASKKRMHLERIVIHPEDMAKAPKEYRGLPIVSAINLKG